MEPQLTQPQAKVAAVDGDDPRLAGHAREYHALHKERFGLDLNPEGPRPSVDPEQSTRAAAAWGKAAHNPNHPKIKEAYDAYKEETKAQYEFLKNKGVKFEPWRGEGQPYHNSKEMMADARGNDHLWYFPTGSGFNVAGERHPMLEEMPGHPGVTYGDAFRAIHDYFGHAVHGYQFGPKGELYAWAKHARLYSKKARPALTNETYGFNSWFNYGPHSHLPQNERPFGDNRASILPKNVVPSLPDHPKARLARDGYGEPEKLAAQGHNPYLEILENARRAMHGHGDRMGFAILADQLDESGLPHGPVWAKVFRRFAQHGKVQDVNRYEGDYRNRTLPANPRWPDRYPGYTHVPWITQDVFFTHNTGEAAAAGHKFVVHYDHRLPGGGTSPRYVEVPVSDAEMGRMLMSGVDNPVAKQHAGRYFQTFKRQSNPVQEPMQEPEKLAGERDNPDLDAVMGMTPQQPAPKKTLKLNKVAAASWNYIKDKHGDTPEVRKKFLAAHQEAGAADHTVPAWASAIKSNFGPKSTDTYGFAPEPKAKVVGDRPTYGLQPLPPNKQAIPVAQPMAKRVPVAQQLPVAQRLPALPVAPYAKDTPQNPIEVTTRAKPAAPIQARQFPPLKSLVNPMRQFNGAKKLARPVDYSGLPPHPVHAVLRAVYPQARKVSMPGSGASGLYSIPVGDREITVGYGRPRGRNMDEVGIGFVNKGGDPYSHGKEGVREGTASFLRGLSKMVHGLAKAGVRVTYSAENRRARVYRKLLEHTGMKQVEGPMVEDPTLENVHYNYAWEPTEAVPDEPAKLARVQESGSIASALRDLLSKRQQAKRQLAVKLAGEAGLQITGLNDSASLAPRPRASVVQTVTHGGDHEAVDLAASWYGLLAREPRLTVFHEEPQGPDRLHIAKSPMGVSQILASAAAYGLGTSAVGKDGTVHTLDHGGDDGPRIEAFHKAIRASQPQVVNGFARRLGSESGDDAKSRRAYRETIKNFQGT